MGKPERRPKGGRSLQSHGRFSKVYVPVLSLIFRRRYKKGVEVIEFTLDDVRKALLELKLARGRNPADIIYRMRSRTLLPEAIRVAGFNVLRATGRGRYRFERAENTILAIPNHEVTEALDLTPLPVRRLLPRSLGRIDEQGLLSMVGYCKLLDHFTGLTVYRLRSHVRKSVAGVGQAELDEVDVGVALRDDEIPVVIPIEAKAADEPVNRVQISYQIAYTTQYFQGYEVRPICLKVDDEGLIHLLEFNVAERAADLRITRSAAYRLKLSDAQDAVLAR